MELEKLTEDERKELEEYRALKARKAAEEKAKEQREEYRMMVDDEINKNMAMLVNVSELISKTKKEVMDNFKAVLDLKKEVLYNKKVEDQRSHTFTSSDGTMRITIGFYVLDSYTDTVEEGISMVNEYIQSLASDDKSKMLVEALIKLLSRNNKGILKASKVLQLKQMADKSGSDLFKKGVAIIEESYSPVTSKTFIRADKKGDNGEWVPVSLGMTEG